MGDIERVRVLVVGDSGVGKTSLTWLLRSGESFEFENLFISNISVMIQRCQTHHGLWAAQ